MSARAVERWVRSRSYRVVLSPLQVVQREADRVVAVKAATSNLLSLYSPSGRFLRAFNVRPVFLYRLL
jgi:hypothetical protein